MFASFIHICPHGAKSCLIDVQKPLETFWRNFSSERGSCLCWSLPASVGEWVIWQNHRSGEAMEGQGLSFPSKKACSYFLYPVFIKHLLFRGFSVGSGEKGSLKNSSFMISLGTTTHPNVSYVFSKRPNSKYFGFASQKADVVILPLYYCSVTSDSLLFPSPRSTWNAPSQPLFPVWNMQPGFLVNLTLLYRFTSMEVRGRIYLFALLNRFPARLIKALTC